MYKGVIIFSTVTCAMKAQSLLQRSGIRADILKTQDKEHKSCQYSLSVRGNFDVAVGLLNTANIPYQSAEKAM